MRRALSLGLGAGCVLGVATRSVYKLPADWWWIAKVGTPWLAVAFGVGLAVRGVRRGAVAGSACLVSATLVYYAIMGLLQHDYDASPLGLGWLTVAIPAGLLFGALGSAARESGTRAPAAAALSAAFAAEAVTTEHRLGRISAVLLLFAALLVPLILGRTRGELLSAFRWAAALSFVAVSAAGVVFAVTGYG